MFGINVKFSTLLGIAAAALLGGSSQAFAQQGMPPGLKGAQITQWQKEHPGGTTPTRNPSTRVGPFASPTRTYGYQPPYRQDVVPSTPAISTPSAAPAVQVVAQTLVAGRCN